MIRWLALLIAATLAACNAPAPVSPANTETIEITVTVPEGTGDVYITGNLVTLGPWNANGALMAGKGTQRRIRLERPAGHVFEYKFTLGSWQREGLGPSGMVMANNVLSPNAFTAQVDVADFKKPVAAYIATPEDAGIIGTLAYWQDVASANLSETRHVTIWTPPGYDTSDQRYRVIYMSDGQNLFDPRIANTGTDWGADEAMAELMNTGVTPAIIVSTWSTSRRAEEYSPWHGAPDYTAFLIEELMPRVNAEYRTLTGPDATFHAGSSMGGLLSYYVVTRHPDVFGACGCVSAHTPFSEAVVAEYFPDIEARDTPDETPYILRDLEGGLTPPPGVRFWFDYGTEGLDAAYGPGHDALKEWLTANNRIEGTDFVIRQYDGADHNERSWRARLPDVFRFLLAPRELPE